MDPVMAYGRVSRKRTKGTEKENERNKNYN
jgi:hypothetical protein